MEEYGMPICIISAGLHDANIHNITRSDYADNVRFMLDLFTNVCEHIIWLGNTAPRSSSDASKYKQTRSSTKSWNSAVMELIGMETKFFHKISFVDVHDASLTWNHRDRIHMDKEWYQQLGNGLFLPLVVSNQTSVECPPLPDLSTIGNPGEVNRLRRILAMENPTCYVRYLPVFANYTRNRLNTVKNHLMLHIPKTGGTALCQEAKLLNKQVPEESVNCWERQHFYPMWCCGIFTDRKGWLDDKDSANTTSVCDVLDHKLPLFTMNENYLDHPLCLNNRIQSALLRDPIERVLSHVENLGRISEHRQQLGEIYSARLRLARNNYMTWALSVGSIVGQSKVRRLPDRELLEVAKSILLQLDFLLELSNANQNCNHITLRLMGFRVMPHKNNRHHIKRPKMLHNITRKQYAEWNALDIELYQYAQKLMEIDCDFYLNWIMKPGSNDVPPKATRAAKDDVQYDATPTKDTQVNLEPLSVCGRISPIPHEEDTRIKKKYASECSNNGPPEETSILLLEGIVTHGRTGNNLIEFLHALQYAKDYGLIVGIMKDSWSIRLITDMWMAVQDDSRRSPKQQKTISEWKSFFEEELCVKIINSEDDLDQYQEIIGMETKDLFRLQHDYHISSLDEYVEFQSHTIRTLFRSYNGYGVNMRNQTLSYMCSVLDAVFGSDKDTAKYSVIHSRSFFREHEGRPGKSILGRIAKFSGCDNKAALDMEPDYIKSILEESNMLDHPIIFISDHQRPEILQKLLADRDIGPYIQLIPDEASWIGGDLTVAITSTVFIGNPASTFSGFIAKSRIALEYGNSYLFRKKNEEDGKWVDVCNRNCIFNTTVMHSMA